MTTIRNKKTGLEITGEIRDSSTTYFEIRIDGSDVFNSFRNDEWEILESKWYETEGVYYDKDWGGIFWVADGVVVTYADWAQETGNYLGADVVRIGDIPKERYEVPGKLNDK